MLPLVTLYRNGLANLNREAARVLPRDTHSLILLAPTYAEPRWVVLIAGNSLRGDVKLLGRADRGGTFRFRAPAMALSLFAAIPTTQPAIRLHLEPDPHSTQVFRLLPVDEVRAVATEAKKC